MGFTIGAIGSIRDTSDRRSVPRRRTRDSDHIAVSEYASLWGWAVVPGARARRSGGHVRCSCGVGDCAAPGAHPLDTSLEVPAGATLEEVTRAWSRVPGASLLLPAGRSFDVLQVSESVGRQAIVRLERMGLPLGPVAATPHQRAWFLVARGAATELPGLLYRMGWDDPRIDLRGLGAGDHITAPPSDLGGLGPVRWLRAPTPESAREFPEARLLLGTLAYVSQRTAVR